MNRCIHNQPLPTTIYITDRHRSDAKRVIPNLPRPSIIILRDYDHPSRKAYLSGLVKLARRYGHIIMVAGNLPLAISLKADGLHLPEYMLPKLKGIKRLWPHLIYSAATHDAPSLKLARRMQADFVLLSPIFPTSSDKSKKPLGPIKANALINRYFDLHIYALGGINHARMSQLTSYNFSGFAGISLFSPPNMLPSSNITPQKTGFYSFRDA